MRGLYCRIEVNTPTNLTDKGYLSKTIPIL